MAAEDGVVVPSPRRQRSKLQPGDIHSGESMFRFHVVKLLSLPRNGRG